MAFVILCVFFPVLSLHALAADPVPNGFSLSWDKVDGAVYYDIYVDSVFVERLGFDTFSHVVDDLLADHAYQVAVAARDGGNRDLEAWFAEVRTGSWDGEYLWVNPTDEDNHGLVKELRMRVETDYDPVYGQYYRLSIVRDGVPYQFFPLYPLGGLAPQWTSYKDDSIQAEVYRKCSELINTSRMLKPSSWRVGRIELQKNGFVFTVVSRAFGIKVETVNTFSFRLENGVRKLDYRVGGDDLFMSIAFVNPEPGSDGVFTLTFNGDT